MFSGCHFELETWKKRNQKLKKLRF